MAIWSYMRGSDTLDIKVGYTCNNRCLHCVVEPVRNELVNDKENIDLTTQEVVEKIDAAASMNMKEIVLTGGEVTLRNDFQKLVIYAVNKGLKVNIQTNGRKFADKKYCEYLKDLPGIVFIIALHASTEKIHDAITQKVGSFNETIGGIRNLLALNMEVTTKIVISKFNAKNLFDTAKLSKELGVSEFSVVYPHLPGYNKDQFEDIAPKYAELKDQIEQIAEFGKKESFVVDFETIPYCISPDSEYFWLRNCDLLTKSRMNDCDSDNKDDKNGFNWETIRPEMKIKGGACSFCAFNLLCEGPWGEYVENYGASEFVPIRKESVEKLF